MTIRVELGPETEARLKAEAVAKGVSLEELAQQVLKEALAKRPFSHGSMTIEEFHRMLAAMGEGSERLPHLPSEAFSRESFYEDRVDGGNSVPRR